MKIKLLEFKKGAQTWFEFCANSPAVFNKLKSKEGFVKSRLVDVQGFEENPLSPWISPKAKPIKKAAPKSPAQELKLLQSISKKTPAQRAKIKKLEIDLGLKPAITKTKKSTTKTKTVAKRAGVEHRPRLKETASGDFIARPHSPWHDYAVNPKAPAKKKKAPTAAQKAARALFVKRVRAGKFRK